MNIGLTSRSVRCLEVGHTVKECKETRFRSRYPGPLKVNLEAEKSKAKQTSTEDQGTSLAWDQSTVPAEEGSNTSAW